MGHIDKGDPQCLLNALELVLHILAQPQIQRTQRFIQQQHLRSVYQSAGDGHALLLTAGKAVNMPIFIALQADNFQHLANALVNLAFGNLGNLEAEGDVIINIQMREQSVSLKHGVDLPLIGRYIVDDFTVKGHRAGSRR